MARDDFSIILPISQLQYLLNSVQQVPALLARLQQAENSIAALRGLYDECLQCLSQIKKDM